MVFKLIRSVFGLDGADAGTDVPIEEDDENTVAADADASGATGSMADVTDDSTGAADPAEAAGGASTESAADTEPDVETPESAAAAGTDAGASTGSLTEAPPEADAAAEPAEAAGPSGEDDEAEGVPIEEVTGIGPAYAQRLNDAGIETVGDLLAADADDIAESTDLSSKRIGRWQDAAEGN
jgi:predicted flap endonuclease-1-like 5' DNA nuclease